MSPLLYAIEGAELRALPIPDGTPGLDGLYDDLDLGVYEALRTYHHNRFLGLDEHLARLTRSMSRLGWSYPFDEARMRRGIHRACSDAPFAEMRVRVDVLAGPATARGSASRELIALSAFTPPPPAIYSEGVAAVTTDAISRLDPLAKTADFVARRAQIERATPEAYERLITDRSGAIPEGFSSNFYVVRDGELVTAGAGVLEGITRRIVLEQAARLGIPVRLETPLKSELGTIEEAAISSSSRGLVPVVSIDGRTIGDGNPGPVIRALHEAYEDHVAMSVREAL